MNVRQRLPWRLAAAICLVTSFTGCARPPNEPQADLSGVYAPPVFIGTPAVREPDRYPFTEAGERAFNEFDAIAADPRRIDDCVADGMPGILWSASPMEIIAEDDRIVLRYERGNTLRSIPISSEAAPPDQHRTTLGYSVARWEGAVLTIETTHMLSEIIRNNNGHPLSAQARLTERYERDAGNNDLRLEVLVEDPVNYTEPFTLGREWVWAPDEEILPFDCVSLGPMDEEPDFDELARMLEEMD